MISNLNLNFKYLILLLILLTGCDTYFDEKLINHSIDSFPQGLDPAKNFGIDEVQIYSQIYERLFNLDLDQQTLNPVLVKNWESSNNHSLYTFYLKPNVTFHDGTKFNATVAKYSFDRQIKFNESSPLFNMINSIDVIDSLTIRFSLINSSPIFLNTLASPLGLTVISKKAILEHGGNAKYHPVGTGPYQLYNWQDNQQIDLQLYKNYHKETSNVKKIRFKYWSNPYESQQSLADQETDILYGISGYFIDRLRWLGTIEYATLEPINTIFLGFNNQSFPFNNKWMRKAILKSINAQRLVFYLTRGNSITAKGPLPPGFFDYMDLDQASYDTEEAKMLMKRTGYENGLEINFFFPKPGTVRYTIIENIKNELNKIGITLDVTMFDTWEEHNQACLSDSAQMFFSGWRSEVLGDPENFLFSLFHSKSAHNVLHYSNDKVDLWLEQARMEPSRELRQRLYRQIVRQILEDTPAVFLYHVKPHFAFNCNKIKSIPVSPYGIIQYHRVLLNP